MYFKISSVLLVGMNVVTISAKSFCLSEHFFRRKAVCLYHVYMGNKANTTITHRRPTDGTVRKSHRTVHM